MWFSNNSYRALRSKRLQASSKPFAARGILVERCEQCLLPIRYCICNFLKPFDATPLGVDIVLLMHSDEILKPTNTGRLASAVFPKNCGVYEWSRLAPNPELLQLLQEPHRECVVIYPATLTRPVYVPAKTRGLLAENNQGAKKLTLVLLDGTWRQAARMINHSRWLDKVPSMPLLIDDAYAGCYAMRKSTQDSRLSTAEAIGIALAQVGEPAAAHYLHQIFSVFNTHYSAARACDFAPETEAHRFLKSAV